jgi:hypothetical protein
MTELFGTDIAALVADALGDSLHEVTISRLTNQQRQSGNLTGGKTKTPVTFTARGIWEDYQPHQIDGDRVRVNDRKALLLGGTIPDGGHPQPGDKITIEGATLVVQRRQSGDPAAASFVYQCRDLAGADGQ